MITAPQDRDRLLACDCHSRMSAATRLARTHEITNQDLTMRQHTTDEPTTDSNQEAASKQWVDPGWIRRCLGLTVMGSNPRYRWVSTCIGLLLVLATLVAVGPAAGAATEIRSQVQTNDTDEPVNNTTARPGERINISYTFRNAPNRKGEVLVTANVTLPTDISSFQVAPPEGAIVQRTRGFIHEESGALTWERSGSQRRLSISYLASVNSSSGGDTESVETGHWALFDWRTAGLDWEYERTNNGSESEPIETAHVTGQGVAGPNFAYLGAYQAYNQTVDGTTIQLIVPKSAQPASRPQKMLSELVSAEQSLQMDGQASHVDVFVAPPPIDVSGLSGGVAQSGRRDILVHQSIGLVTPDNVLLHEYLHTTQEYTTTNEMEWLVEASGEYYGAVLAYRQGLVSFEEFHSYVESETYPKAVLSDSESWSSSRVAYIKGMRTLAALDAKIRTTSNGTQSLEDVFQRLNQHAGTVTYNVFATYVAQAAGESLTGWLDRHVQSSATANVPATASQYDSATRTSTTSTVEEVSRLIQIGIASAPPVLLIGGFLLLVVGWARNPPPD
jgi:hypothetical protein